MYNVTYDKRTPLVGSVRGEVFFMDGSTLQLREFVNVQHEVERFVYAYRYNGPDGRTIFGYDNLLQYPHLATPHHRHEGNTSVVVLVNC